MANKDRFSKLKIYKYTPGGMIMSFIIIFAGVGTYVVTQSRADNVTYSGFYNSANAETAPNVAQTTDDIGHTGLQPVNQISPGGQLVYSLGQKTDYKSICYYLKAISPNGSGVAQVEIVGKGKSKVITLEVSDKYTSACVGSGSKNQKPYNVYNNSSPAGPSVLVYQAITSY